MLIFIPTTTLYLNAIPKENAAYNEESHVPVRKLNAHQYSMLCCPVFTISFFHHSA